MDAETLLRTLFAAMAPGVHSKLEATRVNISNGRKRCLGWELVLLRQLHPHPAMPHRLCVSGPTLAIAARRLIADVRREIAENLDRVRNQASALEARLGALEDPGAAVADDRPAEVN